MPYSTKWEPTIRGRLQTLLACNGGEADFAALLKEATDRLGPSNSVTLLTEALCEQVRSYRRPVDESVASWDRLRQRAQECLDADDTTLMTIRSHYLRFLRLRGKPSDLDEVVSRRRDEVNARTARLADDDNYVGIARADLAVALIDRVRTFGRCAVPSADPGADLRAAENLIDGEIARRARLYIPTNSTVQSAKLIMSELLLGMAEHQREHRLDFARKALAMTGELVDYFWEQSGNSSPEALRSLMAQAQALGLLDHHDEAARMARQAWRISAYVTRHVDRGWPPFVLAMTLLPVDRHTAQVAASDALAARESLFPADSCRFTEVRRFMELACRQPTHSRLFADLYEMPVAVLAHSRGIQATTAEGSMSERFVPLPAISSFDPPIDDGDGCRRQFP